MRLRKIDDCVAELRASDPGCALTRTALRKMVVTGQIPSISVGAKYLVDLDRLENYLFSSQPAERSGATGTIRPVNIGRRQTGA